MTYKEIYEKAANMLDRGKITLGDFNKMVEPLNSEVQSEPNWIPVTERLPERSGDYLITRDVIEGYEKEACSIDYFEADTLDWDGYGDLVTAWMPLQEPYKGVNV